MNKLVKSLAIIAVVVIALGTASSVFAQTTGPGTRAGVGIGTRNGRGSGAGLLGEPIRIGDNGLLHEYFIAAYAEKLDIDAETLESRLEAGETMAEIAGLSLEDFQILRTEVREIALDLAVEAGAITEEQAEWLASRGNRMSGPGLGQGASMRGKGQGLRYTNGTCIYD
jgi:hypothetical protein